MARVRLPWPRLPAVRLSRPVMLMVLAAVAGVAAALAARQHIEGHVARLEADAKTPVLERVVAAYDLPAGTRLEPAHLATRPYPAALVPSDSVDPVAHSRLLGMVLQSGLRAGDLIVPAHGRKMQPGAFSSHLGEGRRAITMPVDAISSVSGLLQPGDLIDLYVSFEHQRRRITAPLLQGVLVLATGTQTQTQEFGTDPRQGYSTVTLDASPEDAVKLVAARQGGTITAVLRHPGDDQPTRKAVRGDLASLLGVAQGAPTRASPRAPVLYGNQSARNVPRLSPTPPVRNPSGVFELPSAQELASAWLRMTASSSSGPAESAPAHEAFSQRFQNPEVE